MGVVSLSVEGVEQEASLLERDKIIAASHRYQIKSIQSRGAAFDEAYAMLDSFFGARGELEEKEALGAMLEERDIWFADNTLFTRYHVLTASHKGELVGVRDCYTEIDPQRRLCVIALSHSLLAPEHRRTGLAALFRALPILLARGLCQEFFPGDKGIPIIASAEMEPVEPRETDSWIRYIAYGRAGFAAIDPTYLPYSQPDFRDLETLGLSHVGIPLIAVVRWVGHESARVIPAELASIFPRHYNGFHYRYTKRENVDAMVHHAISTLTSKGASEVPLLPLPTNRGELSRLEPLLKSRVLPLYPNILRGEEHPTSSIEEGLALLRKGQEAIG